MPARDTAQSEDRAAQLKSNTPAAVAISSHLFADSQPGTGELHRRDAFNNQLGKYCSSSVLLGRGRGFKKLKGRLPCARQVESSVLQSALLRGIGREVFTGCGASCRGGLWRLGG